MSATTDPADPVDLDQCAAEPIERPGTVQPHGVMLVARGDDHTLLAASGSAAILLPGTPTRPGTPLTLTLGEDLVAEIDERLADEDLAEPIRTTGPAAGPWAGRPVDVMLHRSGERLVVELEAVTDVSLGRGVTLSATRSAITRLQRCTGSREVLHQLARAVRRVTGFDRVLVYRFDRQWNGQVIAEDRAPHVQSFAGLHFPAADIPAQARALYALNRLRFIVDSHAAASPLHPPVPDDGGGELDMSFAPLRSVSPVHLEYLRGMGVRASMSVSILRDGRLWGLVACHHYAGPLQPSHDERAAADLIVQGAVPVLIEREAQEDAALLAGGRERLDGLTAALRGPLSPVAALAAGDLAALARLADATGVVLRSGGRWARWGVTVDDERAGRILAALRRPGRGWQGVPVASEHLDELRPGLGTPDAAGALALILGDDEWVLWLGEAVERAIEWAGDPDDKTITMRADGTARIGPRKSFAAAREILRGRSRPWDSWKMQSVAALGQSMLAADRARQEESLQVADDLADSLSPAELPSFAGLDLAVRYVPAAGGRFAGDWWDSFELPGGRVALIVGDVVGHGSAAAVTMTQLRTALRAYLVEGRSPAEALSRLDGLARLLFPNRLTTVLLAVVDRTTGEVELARAGHPHPLVAGPDGATVVEVATRPPIGIGLDSQVPPVVLTLAPGGTLVLVSDGLLERRNASVKEGFAVLAGALAEHREAALETLTGVLLNAVPGLSDDDRTVLAVRLTA